MNPIRRELVNGLLVLVVASLLSVAFSAFQVSFNALLWVLILAGIAIATGFYVVFELTLGFIASSGDREKEGDVVFDEGIRQARLYIVPHKEMAQYIRNRFDGIMKDI